MKTNKICVLVSVITLIYTGNNAKCASIPGQYVYQSTATELTAQEVIKSCKNDWAKLQVEVNTNIDKDKNLTSDVRMGKYVKFRQQLSEIIKRVYNITPTDNTTAQNKKDLLQVLREFDETLVNLQVPRGSNFIADHKQSRYNLEQEINLVRAAILKECYKYIEKLGKLREQVKGENATEEEKKPLLDQLRDDRAKVVQIIQSITS